MLIILNDPAGITGIRRLPLDYSITLQQNIERHLSGGGGSELRINGSVVDPLTDPRLDMPPSRFDQVAIALRPAGFDPITWAYIALAAVVVAAVALRPNIPNVDGGGKDSPNNKLTAQSNVARAYQAIPDVYGFKRCWPDLIQPSTVEYISQVKYVTEWLCISRGKGTISAVQYAETPIGDIEGSSFEIFEPLLGDDGYYESGTTTLSDVYETFESDEVNGQELAYAIAFDVVSKTAAFSATNGTNAFKLTIADGTDLDQLKSISPSGTASVQFTYDPVGGPPPQNFSKTCTLTSYTDLGATVEFNFTYSGSPWGADESDASVSASITPNGATYETSGPFTMPINCSQIWWNTVFLRGLKGTVTVRAEWWQVDADGVEIPATRETQDNSYGADTFDQRFYTNKVTPAAGFGRYRIQFQRRTVKVDENGSDVAKLEEVYAVRYFPTKLLTGVTVLRVTTKATLAATGFSDRKFNARWFRHVRTLSKTEFSASRNFGRIMAHLWAIAGNSMAGLDVAALAAINAQHGEDSPMLRFDGSLDDADMSLGERMQLVAYTARCRVWRDGTRWTVSREQAQQYPGMQFDYRNLAAGGDSTISYAAHLPASNDGIELEYVDEVSQAKKSYVRLNISSGTVANGTSKNPKRIKMIGCATAAQAENRAQLEARRLLYQRVNVSDKALSDAKDLALGELVRWIDPNDFGGDELQAGEVMSISGDLISTSEPLDWGTGTSGRITFTGVDGRRIGPPIACYQAADGLVQLETVPAGLYTADIDRQCGSRYAFAVGVTSAELEASGLYTAEEIKPAADRTVSIALTAYDQRMFEAD